MNLSNLKKIDDNYNLNCQRGWKPDSLCCILVQASVKDVANVFAGYFDLKVYHDRHFKQYSYLYHQANDRQNRLTSMWRRWGMQKKPATTEIAKIHQKLDNLAHPLLIWKYRGHSWTIVYLHPKLEKYPFAFSSLLDTDVISFWIPKHEELCDLKLFRGNKLVEHYESGSQLTNYDRDYWDTIFHLEGKYLSQEHRFSSSIRKITPRKIKLALQKKKSLLDSYAFVDTLLKEYDAYFPTEREISLFYYYDIKDRRAIDKATRNWRKFVERIDIVMVANNWIYYDRQVPRRTNQKRS